MKSQKTVMALLVGALIFTLYSAVPVQAEVENSAVSVQAEVEKLSVGAGLGLAPDYEGSNDYTGILMLFAEAMWDSGRYVKLDGSTLRANILAHDMFRLGPVANYRIGRDDAINVDDDRVEKMKKVDDSFELGAFAGVNIDEWTFMVEALNDVSDGHDGFVLTLSGKYEWPINDSWALSVGASTSYADNDYMSSYFDVDARDSARSGLDMYDADSGFKDVGCNIGVVYNCTDHWSTRISGGFKRLIGDAEDSPIVDDLGDKNQLLLGVMAVYTF